MLVNDNWLRGFGKAVTTIDRTFSAWLELPLWTRLASGVALIVALDAVRMAWPERNFVSGFFQSYLAIVLYYAGFLSAMGAGIWSGVRAADRSGRNWLGWCAGLLCAVVVYAFFEGVIDEMPGVKWRVEAMRDSNCHTDWDGRANPVVCD